MPSLIPIGGAIRLNPSAGGAATIVPLAVGGFAAIYRVANGPDVFTIYDDNFQRIVNETEITSNDFLAPQAAALNDGRFIVAWLAQDQTIQATIYNPDGSLSQDGITLVTPTDASVGLSAPRIIGDAFGGFTAIWQDNATINGVSGTVFVQSYDGEGNAVGDRITVQPPVVNPSDTATISDFRIAVLGDGTTVVAVQAQINGVDSIMYSVNGGTPQGLAGGDPNYLFTNPQVTPLAGGGYVITYDFVNPNLVGTDSPDANWTTGGSVFTSHGTRHDFAIGTTVTTTENGTFAVDPSVITSLADGGFVVTFEPLTSPLGDGYLVDAQQFDAFGNAVGPVVLVAPQGFLPSVATSANGAVLDTFQFGSGVFLQGFNSAPTPMGLEPSGTSFGLNSVVSANSPGVAPLSTGGFVVVYQGKHGDTWAQIYGYNRQPVDDPFRIAVYGTQPVVAAQSNGTFLVAWSTGSRIMGALFDNQGNQLDGPFSMSGDPSNLPVLSPALNATTSGGYSMVYETDLQDGGGSHQVTIQVFDGQGNAIGTAVSQVYHPTNPLAPPKIAALEKQLFGSVTVIGVGNAIFAAIVSDPPTGNSSAGIAGQPMMVTSHAGTQTIPDPIQVSGANDGAERAGSQVTTIGDGDIVVVWNEHAASAGTWQVVGQVMTPTGAFVGSQFSINTALPANSPSATIALSALPGSGYLVTYDSGNATLASQRFDPNGAAIGGPVLMSGSGQAGAVTAVLSDGTVLLLSNSNSAAGMTVTGATFSVPIAPMNWIGATNTDLGTAANWDVNIPPDSGHAMQFGLVNGGTLTGTATADSVLFTGQGRWVLSGEAVSLSQGLTEQGALTVSGGTVSAGGTAAIGVAGIAMLSAAGGANISFLSTEVGTNAGETGSLTLSGVGTTWTDTGSAGAGGLRAGGSSGAQPGHGIVNVTQGAAVTGTDTDVFGVSAGSEGDLSIAGGSVSNSGMVVGAAGMGTVTVTGGTLTKPNSLILGQSAGGQGVLTVSGTGAAVVDSGSLIAGAAGSGSLMIQNQGTVRIGGTATASPGIDLGQAPGGSGMIVVLGANTLLNNSGRFVVGDAGLGSLAITSGGTVVTSPGTVGGLAGLVVSNAGGAAGSSVNVTGVGSNLIVAGLLDVGVGGSGVLQISGGATVSATSLDAGNVAASVGQIGVSGAGSALVIANDATVADDGTGVLSVLNGATFSAASLTIGSLGDSSGALVVSGVGSEVNLTGAINIGTALGTGDLTVGPGAAVHASVVNLQGQVVLEGGLLDPTVQVINQGQTAGGFGTLAADDIIDEGLIQAGGPKATQRLLLVQGTIVGGGTLTKNGTVLPSSAAGLIQINAGGTAELTGPVLNAASTSFQDALTPTNTYTITNSVVDVSFSDAAGVLLLDDIAGFAGTITSFKAGDQFVITGGGTLSAPSISNGNTLTFSDSGVNAGAGGIDRIIFGSPVNAGQFNVVNGNTMQAVACFAAGTMIATTRGRIPVQNVRPGDRVCTVLGGDKAEVVWVGRRAVDCARHPDPTKVLPIRVSAHAFGRGMPSADLLLSPDHAVYVDEVLIPIRLLVNGRTVRQELTERVTYHHIELAHHDVLLANGMPAESYLDTGDKNRFSNGGGVIALHPDFSARTWEMSACAPLVQTGPVLDAVRRRLAADVARRRRVRETVIPSNTWPR